MNGNDIDANKADIVIASNKTNAPNNIPNIVKTIFKTIANMIPSISKEKMIPGRWIVHPEIERKTSPIYDRQIMQYRSANIA